MSVPFLLGVCEGRESWASFVLMVAEQFDCWSVRDYNPDANAKPAFADMVVAIDVLEHVAPDRLDAVLARLRLLARKAVFLTVSELSDGRSAEWWRARLEAAGFTVQPDPQIPADVKRPAHAWMAVVTP